MTARGQLGPFLRFLLVGGTTVLIDAGVYALLSTTGLGYDPAKAMSFIAGAVFAYFANWRFTFGRRRSRWSELLFVLVYLTALLINVLLNAWVRSIDPDSVAVASLAFLVATGTSAAWNFIGMSLFVFARPGDTADHSAPDKESM
ncbi:GtrA family protein [Amnibacterium flavum]|uniref:GtrA family protein n=1 Tax=Amnibacterium flavum TaxID=2173173 RepID=A0A2V1HTG6_9MICO|nr:GtrA family protein [Amnibacterium flavum]PVZ95858.1 GtrA family protein [Amnibacterium flavum]